MSLCVLIFIGFGEESRAQNYAHLPEALCETDDMVACFDTTYGPTNDDFDINDWDRNRFSVLEVHDDENPGNPTDDYDGIVSTKGGSTANLYIEAVARLTWVSRPNRARLCLVPSGGTSSLVCDSWLGEDLWGYQQFTLSFDLAQLPEGDHDFYLVVYYEIEANSGWLPQFRTQEFTLTFDVTSPEIDFVGLFEKQYLIRRDQLDDENKTVADIRFSEPLHDNGKEVSIKFSKVKLDTLVKEFNRGGGTDPASLSVEFTVVEPDKDILTTFQIRNEGQYDLAGNQYQNANYDFVYDAKPPLAQIGFNEIQAQAAAQTQDDALRLTPDQETLTVQVSFDDLMDAALTPALEFLNANGDPTDVSLLFNNPDQKGVWTDASNYQVTYGLKWGSYFGQLGSESAPLSIGVKLENPFYQEGGVPPLRDGIEDDSFFFDANGVGAVPPTNIGALFYVDRPLNVPTHPLTIVLAGAGFGRVNSDHPVGLDQPIDCKKPATEEISCISQAESGTAVRLTAIPEDGFIFDGWSGCDTVNTSDPMVCDQVIEDADLVRATFLDPAPTTGTIVIAKRIEQAAAGDHSFEFAGDPPVSGLLLSTFNGVAASRPYTVQTGIYTVAEVKTDENWRLTAIECVGDAGGGSVVDLDAGSVDIDVDPDEALVCTFVGRRIETQRTSRIIRNFMVRRAAQIVVNEPNLADRISDDRSANFTGTVNGGAGLNMNYALALESGASLPGQLQGQLPGTLGRLGAWSEGVIARTEDDEAEQGLALLYAGVDYRISQDIVLGLLGQFDWASESNDTAGYDIDGNGWMVGPYLVAKVYDNIVFDARMAAGGSRNWVNPIGLYEDRFDADRWLARAALTGELAWGSMRVQPHARAIYFEETQRGYRDDLDNRIPSQTVSIGQLDFGPKVSTTINPTNHWTVEPYMSLTGVWTFATTGTVDLRTGMAEVSGNGFHGRIEVGLAARIGNGLSVQLSAFTNSIGQSSRKAYGGKFKASLVF